MQAVVLDQGGEEALSESVGKPRKKDAAKEERPPSLNPEERRLLREITSKMDLRNQELGLKDKRFGSHGKLALLAGDQHPSSLNKWRGPDPSDPRLFHLRRYLVPLGLDFQIVTKGGNVSAPPGSSLSGDDMNDDTKDMVLLMETLPEHARKTLLRLALASAKMWGIEPPSVLPRGAENGSSHPPVIDPADLPEK